jgi:hypothetical protein
LFRNQLEQGLAVGGLAGDDEVIGVGKDLLDSITDDGVVVGK